MSGYSEWLNQDVKQKTKFQQRKATTFKNYSVKKTYKINQDVKNAIEKIKKAAQKKAEAKKAAMKNMMKKMAKAMTKANSHKSHKSHNSYKTFRMAHHG